MKVVPEHDALLGPRAQLGLEHDELAVEGGQGHEALVGREADVGHGGADLGRRHQLQEAERRAVEEVEAARIRPEHDVLCPHVHTCI